MKISRQVGTTNEILNIYVQDVSVSTGAGLANIVASSVSFTWLRNDQATLSSGSCSSGGTIGTYNVSMFTQVNSTSSLGWYQFGVPNGIFTSGRSALLHLYGAPNMVPVPIEVELTKTDNQSYLSTQTVSTLLAGVNVTSRVGVSSLDLPVGVSSFAISVGVSTLVGVSTATATALDSITSSAIFTSSMSYRIWEELLTGATHNVANTAGRRLRQIDAAFEVHSGTAQAGGTTTITLDTNASATDNIYNGDRVVIIAGTGAQEHGIIVSYNGTSKVASMSKAWVVTPTSTSEFEIVPADVDVETWNNATATGDGDWAELQTDVDALAALPVGVSSFAIPVGVSTTVLLDATYGPAGRLSTDVVRVRGQALTGTGVSSDPWGPV